MNLTAAIIELQEQNDRIRVKLDALVQEEKDAAGAEAAQDRQCLAVAIAPGPIRPRGRR